MNDWRRGSSLATGAEFPARFGMALAGKARNKAGELSYLSVAWTALNVISSVLRLVRCFHSANNVA